jgi:hypothetical protein
MPRPDKRFLAELIAVALTAAVVGFAVHPNPPQPTKAAALQPAPVVAQPQAAQPRVPEVAKPKPAVRLPARELTRRATPRTDAVVKAAPAAIVEAPHQIERIVRRKIAEESFTAAGSPPPSNVAAPPVALPDPVPQSTTCGDEGVNHTTHDYTMPADANLIVESAFSGDWDFYIFDAVTGDLISLSAGYQAIGEAGKERATARLRKGRMLKIMSCNYLSEQREVSVHITVVTGDGYPGVVAPPAGFRALAPNALPELMERVPVNVVFIGYQPNQIDAAKFVSGLPQRLRPHVRARDWYGLAEYLGIEYTYDYRLVFADRAYADRFFGTLKRLGREVPLNTGQKFYNDQERNVVEIKTNLDIDAPSVERWLQSHAPAGVDTSRNTLVFINWYGRPDFRFHMYRKTGEATTGARRDLGATDSQALVAWGGTPADDLEEPSDRVARVWFHDLSAGPDLWNLSYNVDARDINDDGREDYRLPPVWEYRTGGYRNPSALTTDLAKVARYVGIDLLFTPSPLYSVALTPPVLPESINIDLNAREGDPQKNQGVTWLTPHVMLQAVKPLFPFTRLEIDQQTLRGDDGEYESCYVLMTQSPAGPSCYPDRPYVNWQSLFLNNALNAEESLDDRSRVDYEVGVWSYFTADNRLSPGYAYADDNQRDGTQSMVHSLLGSTSLASIGGTDILIHELGHHWGLSHPHDGYDYEEDVDFSSYQYGSKMLASVGDMSNGVMSYLWVNNEFSQFDRDNMNRWMAAAYLKNANTLFAESLKRRPAGPARQQLLDADAGVDAVRAAFAGHAYLEAHRLARNVYRGVLDAARSLDVDVTHVYNGLRVDGSDLTMPETSSRGREYAFTDRIEGWFGGAPTMNPFLARLGRKS